MAIDYKDDYHDDVIPSPYLLLLKAELEPLRSQMHEEYSPEYIAHHAFEAIGEETLMRATNGQRKQVLKDFVSKYQFMRVEVPIPTDLLERCFGADAKSPLAARGEAVRTYGEAAVIAAGKRYGFLTIGSLTPERGPLKKAAPAVPDASTNPWAPNNKKPADRLAEQLKVINSKGGAKLAAQLSRAAGRTLADQPLRPTRF